MYSASHIRIRVHEQGWLHPNRASAYSFDTWGAALACGIVALACLEFSALEVWPQKCVGCDTSHADWVGDYVVCVAGADWILDDDMFPAVVSHVTPCAALDREQPILLGGFSPMAAGVAIALALRGHGGAALLFLLLGSVVVAASRTC